MQPGVTTSPAPAPSASPYGDPAAAPAPQPYPQPAPAPQPAAPAPAPAPQLQPQPYAQPAPAPQAAPAYAEPPLEEEPGEKCALDTFCFGPVLTLGAVNPIGIGVHGRLNKHFGFVLDYQFLPSISLNNVDAGFSLFTLAGRWHIAGSSFFLTLGFSYQSFYAEGEVADQNGDMVGIDASVGLPQLAFGLGVLGGQGFVIGIDLAFGVPLGGVDITFDSRMPDSSSNPDLAAAYEDSRQDIETFVEDTLELLPMTFQVNLLRIGYIF